MTQKENILQELQELNSSLTTIASQNVYAVPAGYFDGLAAQVLNRIKAMEATSSSEELSYLSPVLSGMSKKMPYQLPVGYFDGLAENALSALQINEQSVNEELATLSPLLSCLKKEMPYSIPAGYFENLNTDIAGDKTETKIISISHRKWFRMAAAAVITGVILMAGFMISDNSKIENLPTAKYEKKLNKEIKKTSDKDLNDFLQYTEAGLDGSENVKTTATDDVKELLKDVPEDELKEFLEETSDVEPDSETLMMN